MYKATVNNDITVIMKLTLNMRKIFVIFICDN